MTNLTDADLIERIARRRDRDAFAELYERHASSAYNLARYLTGQSGLAEDAVQESLTNVWRYAGTFTAPESRSARSWILRIVANKCARLRKRNHKEVENRHVEAERKESLAPLKSAEAQVERAELLDALRDALQTLDEQDRYLVAMHFGAGLSFQEIARDGEVPATTAAYRVRRALERLRSGLTRLGFAAAGPALAAEALCDALTAGHEVPAALQGQVLRQVSLAGLHTASAASRRAAAVKSGAARYAWLLAALAAAAGCAYLFFPLAPNAQPAQPTQPVATVASNPPATDEPIHRVWTFENGLADDLNVYRGALQWVEARDERPAGIQTSGETQAYLMLPIEPRPGSCWEVALTMFTMAEPGQISGAAAGHVFEVPVRPSRYQWKNTFRLDFDRPILSRTFLLNGWTVVTYGNTQGRTKGYIVWATPENAPDTFRIAARLDKCLLTRVELRELRREEIPEEFRDAQAFIVKKNLGKFDLNVPAKTQPR